MKTVTLKAAKIKAERVGAVRYGNLHIHKYTVAGNEYVTITVPYATIEILPEKAASKITSAMEAFHELQKGTSGTQSYCFYGVEISGIFDELEACGYYTQMEAKNLREQHEKEMLKVVDDVHVMMKLGHVPENYISLTDKINISEIKLTNEAKIVKEYNTYKSLSKTHNVPWLNEKTMGNVLNFQNK